jgi:hypothetical protein
MNRKASSIRRIAAAVILCGVLPFSAWSETTKAKPSRPTDQATQPIGPL